MKLMWQLIIPLASSDMTWPLKSVTKGTVKSALLYLEATFLWQVSSFMRGSTLSLIVSRELSFIFGII